MTNDKDVWCVKGGLANAKSPSGSPSLQGHKDEERTYVFKNQKLDCAGHWH